MRKPLSALLISTMLLSSCGAIRDSVVNPLNWFGNGRSEPVNEGAANPLIPTRSGFSLRRGPQAYQGQPVQTITELKIERAAGGAIVRVKAVARTQGSYEVFLTSDTKGQPVDGVLTYTLKAKTPSRPTAQGPAQSREINAAQFVTDRVLASVRTVRVVGATNAMTARR